MFKSFLGRNFLKNNNKFGAVKKKNDDEKETAYGADYIGEPISPILAFDSLWGGKNPPPVYIYLGFF